MISIESKKRKGYLVLAFDDTDSGCRAQAGWILEYNKTQGFLSLACGSGSHANSDPSP